MFMQNTTLMHKSIFAMAPKMYYIFPKIIKDAYENLFKTTLKSF